MTATTPAGTTAALICAITGRAEDDIDPAATEKLVQAALESTLADVLSRLAALEDDLAAVGSKADDLGTDLRDLESRQDAELRELADRIDEADD